MGDTLLNIRMVRLLSIASLLLLSYISLVATEPISQVPSLGERHISRACASESYDV